MPKLSPLPSSSSSLLSVRDGDIGDECNGVQSNAVGDDNGGKTVYYIAMKCFQLSKMIFLVIK